MIRNPRNLSPRQIEVLQLAVTGMTSKEIGAALHISSKTVDVHFDRLIETMQARSRWHALLLWDRINRAYEPGKPHGTYLSGPITGIVDKNEPAFTRAAAKLRAAGHIVVNPLEFKLPEGAGWETAMRYDIPQLCTCTAIAMLPNWEWSKGAKGELAIARLLGMREIYLDAEDCRAAA